MIGIILSLLGGERAMRIGLKLLPDYRELIKQ